MRARTKDKRRSATKAALLIVVAVVATLATGGLATADEGDGPQVSLRWALGALDPAGGSPTAIARDTQLGTGTRLKLLVEPLSPGSVYLLLLDSSEELHVLYRESSTPSTGPKGEPTYIPPGTQWFELEEDAGMDTFFLLASVEPLRELEQLLDRHAAAEPAGRKAAGASVVEEVLRLNKAHRNFARPVERPVMIGGQTRGEHSTAAAIDRLAVEVEAERFYGKTITIDH